MDISVPRDEEEEGEEGVPLREPIRLSQTNDRRSQQALSFVHEWKWILLKRKMNLTKKKKNRFPGNGQTSFLKNRSMRINRMKIDPKFRKEGIQIWNSETLRRTPLEEFAWRPEVGAFFGLSLSLSPPSVSHILFPPNKGVFFIFLLFLFF